MQLSGQLITLDRSYPLVRITGIDQRAEYSAAFSKSEQKATIGDWLELEQSGAEAVPQIVGVRPRTSLLLRRICREHPSVGEGLAEEQLLAANFDQVFVVVGLGKRPFDPNYLERQLVCAFQSGAAVSVLLNKADLAKQDLDELTGAVQALAEELGVLVCSALTGQGVDQLRGLCAPGSTSVFFGRSGVGKSSLINAIIGSEALAVAATRESDQAGRHTTVARSMVFFGDRAYYDTPGLRSIGIYQHDEGLERVFADVVELAADCRFRDCRHNGEPGCEVQAALDAGQLDPRRLQSYRALAAEVAGDDVLD